MAEGTLRMLLARQPAASLEVLGMLALPPLLVCALFSIGSASAIPAASCTSCWSWAW